MIFFAMDRLPRVIVSAFLVLAACAASFAVARGAHKPFSSDAPAYRKLGPEDAKVVIVEFSDFQCPACKYAEPPMRAILKLYEGKVKLIFKHYPLERMHQFARAGAVAAECAGKQGKFWEYHHELYDRQEEWTNDKAEEMLASYAKTLKLDSAAWLACRKDPAVNEAVNADQKDGNNAWVGSTPTFFINGKRYVGAMQLAERGGPFIEKELKK